jgi:hypothetical protein
MSHSIVVFLKGTAISHAMVQLPWLWPLCETLHFIGLALLIGAAGFFDLRLMGLMRRVPVSAAMNMRPWAGLAVVINVVTGTLFFIGAPDQYIDNPAWWAKVTFLVVAITNIVVFETRYGKQLLSLPPDVDTPVGFKVAGMVSIASWFLVLYFGRMLPFIGTAF